MLSSGPTVAGCSARSSGSWIGMNWAASTSGPSSPRPRRCWCQ
uniref:Uncharacterized protein n=1 Tax=Arundo donax TaxID=35708 RepID=A0A0A9AGM7_ARUDO